MATCGTVTFMFEDADESVVHSISEQIQEAVKKHCPDIFEQCNVTEDCWDEEGVPATKETMDIDSN